MQSGVTGAQSASPNVLSACLNILNSAFRFMVALFILFQTIKFKTLQYIALLTVLQYILNLPVRYNFCLFGKCHS